MNKEKSRTRARFGTQLALIPGIGTKISYKERIFGGAYLGQSRHSHAKGKRALDSRAPIHLVMRSEQACGEKSLLRRSRGVRMLLDKQAQRHGVEILDFANVGNHLHLIIRIGAPRYYRAFIRAFSASVSRLITGANKYKKVGMPFWDQRPFTRVLASAGLPLLRLRRYLETNKLEALGFTAPSARTLLALGLAPKKRSSLFSIAVRRRKCLDAFSIGSRVDA